MKKSDCIFHTLLAIPIAAVFYFIMRPVILLPTEGLIIDSLILGILFSGLSLLLKDIVKYGNYASLPVAQCIINYTALAVLFILCTVGLGFYLSYLIISGDDTISVLLPTVPLRVVIAVLFFGFLILFYGWSFVQKSKQEDIAEEHEVMEELITENESELPIAIENEEDAEIIDHIAVKNGSKIDLVLIPEIIYLQAEGDYVRIHSTKGRFTKEQTMKYFENHLPKNKFVRIHRSGIVNIDYIASIESYEKQNQILILKNNMSVKVSLSGYRTLKKVLNL